MNNGAKGTMPYHLWKAAVIDEAIASQCDREGMDFHLPKISQWFDAGEPVWMASAGLIQIANGYAHAQFIINDAESLRRVCREARRD